MGASDRRIEGLVAEVDEVVEDGVELDRLSPRERRELRAARGWAVDQVGELLACGLPATLVHGDLHTGNIAVDPLDPDAPVVLFDWTDTCISHPFLDVAQLGARRRDDPGIEAWRAAYREPWRDGFDDAVLSRALAVAPAVDLLFQTVTYETIQRSLEPAARDLGGVQVWILRRPLTAASRAESSA